MIAVEILEHPGGHEVCVLDTEPLAEQPAPAPGIVAPTVDPLKRVDPPPADSYEAGDPVWAWIRHYKRWLPGEVGGSGLAVLVRYERLGGGSEVDTVTAEYVMSRDEEC